MKIKKIEKIIELKEKFGKHAPNEMIREELIKSKFNERRTNTKLLTRI